MLPASKTVVAISQASTTNAATASGNIDRLGYDFAEIDIIMATSNDVTNNPTVLKLSESDDTVVTNFANVSGFVGDTDFTIPNAVTNNGPQVVRFNVDLRGRKRYLKVSVSPVTTQLITAVAHLHRGKEAPVSAAEVGAAAVVNG